MKVAINGTGIAGPALAWWLSYYGHEPVLFEQAPALRRGGYMIDFWGIGYDIAERMGVLPALQERGYRIEALRLVDAHGKRLAETDTDGLRAATGGRFLSIARSDVAAVLHQVCTDIPTHFGTSITDLDQNQDGVTVTLSNGQQQTFDCVVGADGLHSHTRGLLFGDQDQHEHPLGACVAAFTLSGYPHRDTNLYLCHQAQKKQLARVSLRDNRTLFLFTFRSTLLDQFPDTLPAQQQALRCAFADMGWEVREVLSRMEEADDFYFDRVSQIKLPTWSQGRVALIGDAAACISLLGGEGTGLAITEAYVLAGELHRCGGDIRTALQQYEARLRPLLESKQKSAQGLVSFFAPDNRLALFINRVVTRLASNTLLSKLIVGRMLRDNIDLPDYPGQTE